MKRFVLVPVGFETMTRETRDAWTGWFDSIRDHVLDSGNPFGEVRSVTKDRVEPMPRDRSAITGYVVIRAIDMEAALEIARGCPVVTGVRVYEQGVEDWLRE